MAERPPAWVLLPVALLLGGGVLGGWLLWHEPGLTLLSGLVVFANLVALAWWVWGPNK